MFIIIIVGNPLIRELVNKERDDLDIIRKKFPKSYKYTIFDTLEYTAFVHIVSKFSLKLYQGHCILNCTDFGAIVQTFLIYL